MKTLKEMRQFMDECETPDRPGVKRRWIIEKRFNGRWTPISNEISRYSVASRKLSHLFDLAGGKIRHRIMQIDRLQRAVQHPV